MSKRALSPREHLMKCNSKSDDVIPYSSIKLRPISTVDSLDVEGVAIARCRSVTSLSSCWRPNISEREVPKRRLVPVTR